MKRPHTVQLQIISQNEEWLAVYSKMDNDFGREMVKACNENIETANKNLELLKTEQLWKRTE